MPSIRQQKETNFQALSPRGSDLVWLVVHSVETIQFLPRGLNCPLQLCTSTISMGSPAAHSIDMTHYPEWAILFTGTR
jgi:hypothetical protein